MTREIFLFRNHAENEAGKLVQIALLSFKKSLYWVKASGLQLDFTISIALKLAYNKNNLFKTLHYWSRDMLNFYFLDKVLLELLGIVSPPQFIYHFLTKLYPILCSINWPNFIVWLPLLLEILGNMFIATFFNQVVTS